MNDPADSVKKIEAHQNLSANFFYQIQRQAFVVVPFQYLKQVDSQNLEDHTEVVAVRSLVKETVEKIQDMSVILIEFFLMRFIFL